MQDWIVIMVLNCGFGRSFVRNLKCSQNCSCNAIAEISKSFWIAAAAVAVDRNWKPWLSLVLLLNCVKWMFQGIAPESRSAIYRETAKTLASLHSAKVDSIGLGNYGRRNDYCKRQVSSFRYISLFTVKVMSWRRFFLSNRYILLG